MVNENLNEFLKEQHKSSYLGGANGQRQNSNPNYNNRNNTDKAIGATGRDVFKK